MTEEKPTVWNEIYQYTDDNNIAHYYYDNGYLETYDKTNKKDLGTRKMTEEDHKFLEKKLDSMNKAFKRAYEGMARMSKDVEEKKFRD